MSEARISNRDLGVWIVEEKGDATAYPTAAESVGVRSDVSLSQPRQYVDSEERRPGLARRERLAALYDPGEWAIETYLRPGGAAKQSPAETRLLECLLGRVDKVRRTYRPRAADSNIPKCRIYVRKGQTLYVAHDAIVTEATLTLGAAGTDLAMGRWGGQCARLQIVAPRALGADASAASSGDQTIVVDHTRHLEVGDRLQIGKEDNAVGFEVKTIASSGGSVTLEGESKAAAGTDGRLKADASEGTLVLPYTPAHSPPGRVIPGRVGTITAARGGGSAETLPVLSAEITLRSGLAYLPGEHGQGLYPVGVYGGVREVEVSLDIAYQRDSDRYFGEHSADTAWALTVRAGAPSGADGTTPAAHTTLTITCPALHLDWPEITDDDPRVVRVSGPCYATAAGDDEVRIVYS